MKKSNFTAMILGTIGMVFFALGMCMALLPEWGMFRQGIAAVCTGVFWRTAVWHWNVPYYDICKDDIGNCYRTCRNDSFNDADSANKRT